MFSPGIRGSGALLWLMVVLLMVREVVPKTDVKRKEHVAARRLQAGNNVEHVANKVLHLCKPNHICAEVGVWKGEFTKEILNRHPKTLYLIDPWLFQTEFPGRWFSGGSARSQTDMDEIADTVAKKYGRHGNVEIVRKKSDEAFKQFEDGFFDWVYIDGNHEYAPTLQDLKDAYRTVKVGGYVTGDDYMWGNSSRVLTVKAAVQDFVKEMNLPAPELHEVGGWQFVIKKL